MLSTKIWKLLLLKTWLLMEGLCIEPQRSLTVDPLQVTDRKEYKESTYEDILRIDQEEIYQSIIILQRVSQNTANQ